MIANENWFSRGKAEADKGLPSVKNRIKTTITVEHKNKVNAADYATLAQSAASRYLLERR